MTTIPSRTMTQTEAIAHAGLETRNGDTVLVVCASSPAARAAYDQFVEVLAGPPGRNGLRCICTYGNYQLVNDTTGGRITFAWPGRDNLVGDSAYLLGYRDWPRDLDLGLMGMWMNSRTRVVTVVETAAAEVPVSGTSAGPWAAALDHRMARQLDEQNRVVELLADEIRQFGGQRITAPRPDGSPLLHAIELISERLKVKRGPYGPAHDIRHGYLHLTGLVRERLDGMGGEVPRDRRAWVEVGQFVLAALEVIDAPVDGGDQ